VRRYKEDTESKEREKEKGRKLDEEIDIERGRK